MEYVEVQRGRRKVKISGSDGDIRLHVSKNGSLWAGIPVDDKSLRMVKKAIDMHFELVNHPDRWSWQMDYCQEHGMSPSLGWEKAREAYLETHGKLQIG